MKIKRYQWGYEVVSLVAAGLFCYGFLLLRSPQEAKGEHRGADLHGTITLAAFTISMAVIACAAWVTRTVLAVGRVLQDQARGSGLRETPPPGEAGGPDPPS